MTDVSAFRKYTTPPVDALVRIQQLGLRRSVWTVNFSAVKPTGTC